MILLSGCLKEWVHLMEKVVGENLSNWDRSIGGQSTPARNGEASTPRLVVPCILRAWGKLFESRLDPGPGIAFDRRIVG